MAWVQFVSTFGMSSRVSQQSSSSHQHHLLQTAIEHAMLGPGWKIHLSRKVSAALNRCRWKAEREREREFTAGKVFLQPARQRREWSPQPPCCLDAPTNASSDCTGPVLRQMPFHWFGEVPSRFTLQSKPWRRGSTRIGWRSNRPGTETWGP